MKTSKLTEGIKDNLIAILVIVVGMIILGMFLSTKSVATGTCEGCGASLDNATITPYPSTTHHTLICLSCNTANDMAHTGGNHNNLGYCTVCDYRYLNHGTDETNITKYVDRGDGTHVPVYGCTYSGCSETYNGSIEAHSDVSAQEYNTTLHRYMCNDCGAVIKDEEHYGGNHDKDGVCQGCGYKYQTHGKEEWGYYANMTDAGHEIHYSCIYDGCSYTYKTGTVIPHSGGTHAEGKCEKCGYKYQTHSKSTTVKEYKKTETGHIPVYACSFSGCISTYDGTEVAHTGATHANDGKCTTCEYQYETHSQSTAIKEYKKSATGHTPIYACTTEECTETYDGATEEHTVTQWTDNGNGTHSGNCTVCTYKVTEEHNYEDGKCEDCKIEEPKQECSHIYVTKHDKEQHWEECTKCKETKEGSTQLHKYGKYTDNKDGTHSATCTVCSYKITKEHNYEDGKCADCKAEEEQKEGDKESTPGKEENGATGDTTTADKEYHKAGLQNIIIILILGIGALSTVTIFKMKKYKDI